MCFDSHSIFSLTFLILQRTERDIITNVLMFSCTLPFVVVTFQRNLNSLDRFSKGTQISILFKILPEGVELLQSDGQTHMTKSTVALRNVSKALKIH
jgi:hypothetical protein